VREAGGRVAGSRVAMTDLEEMTVVTPVQEAKMVGAQVVARRAMGEAMVAGWAVSMEGTARGVAQLVATEADVAVRVEGRAEAMTEGVARSAARRAVAVEAAVAKVEGCEEVWTEARDSMVETPEGWAVVENWEADMEAADIVEAGEAVALLVAMVEEDSARGHRVEVELVRELQVEVLAG